MLYFIYEEQELIAETDSLDFVERVAGRHPDCLVKQSGREKTSGPGMARRRPAPVAAAG